MMLVLYLGPFYLLGLLPILQVQWVFPLIALSCNFLRRLPLGLLKPLHRDSEVVVSLITTCIKA